MARSVFLRKIQTKFNYIINKIGKGKVKFIEKKKGWRYKVIFSLKEGEYFEKKDSEAFWSLLHSLAKNHSFIFKRIGKKKEHTTNAHYQILITKRR